MTELQNSTKGSIKLMKIVRMLVFVFMAAFIIPVTAYAAEDIPPLRSAQRISWVMKCAGSMPRLLIVSLVAICVLIVISVIVYPKGGKKNEK